MSRWFLKATTAFTTYVALSQAAMADPISVSILTAVGISATATAVAATTFALTTAATTGLSLLATLLTRKSTTTNSGVQSEVQFGGDVPRQIPFGVCRVAGEFIYFAGVGEKNKTLHLVYALADWECDGLDHVYVDNVKKTLNSVSIVGTEHARYEVQGYSSNFIVKFFRGTMTQTADTELITASGARATGLGNWTSNHKGQGVCYVSLILTFDEDKFQSGIPDLEWQLRGAKLYNWRLDSTNGGSGTHRWNDPTTWAFSKNPIVMEYNFRRGFYRNSQKILGMGMASSDLLHDHYTAAANVCDESVSENAGTFARYECSTIVNDDAEYRAATDTFLGACAGMMVEKSGLFGPFAGAARSSVKTFTDSDLLVGFDTSYSAKLSRSELFNAVYGTFTKASENWQTDSIAPVTNGTAETEDNNERLVKELALPQVISGYQASRIAKIVAALGRMQIRHSGVYGPKFSAVEAGDWVTLTNRFGTNTMMIVAKREVGIMQWQFDMEQTGSSAYGGAASAPSTPPIVVVDTPTHVASISGFAVTAVSIAGANSQIRPGIKVDWTPPTDPSVVAVKIEYRVFGTTTVQPITVLTPLDGTMTIQSDLMAGTVYEVRARYMLNPDLAVTWSSWLSVTTTSIYIVVTSQTASQTQEYFDQLREEIEGNGLSLIGETLKRFQEDDNTRFSFNTSLQQVRATFDNSFAQVSVTLSALAAADQAISSLLAVVQASVGGATAFGAFKMEAVAAEGTAIASIAAYVSADNGASYTRAGWRLDVESGGTGRFVVMADQFAITQNAGSTPFTPFAVIGPDTFINRVVVNDEVITSNYAEDADGYPVAGSRMDSAGTVSGYQSKFFDQQSQGASFTGRPIFTEAPILRNGVMEGLTYQEWAASSNVNASGIAWSFDTDARFLTTKFHRQPDCCFFYGTGIDKGTNSMVTIQKVYQVPNGQLLPTRMIIESSVNPDYIELLQDGSMNYVVLDGNGGISSSNAFDCPWMYDLEIDPENRRGLTTIIGGLGITRGAQPFVVPTCTSLTISLLGAGGGYDDSNAGVQGGPGGFVEFTLPVGISAAVKPGDILWFIIGEGGWPGRSGQVQGYGGAGQSAGNLRAGGGGGTFCFHKNTESRLSLIAVAGGGGAGEGSASGGPGGLTTSTNPSGGQSSGGDTMVRCTGKDWDYTGTLKRGGGGGGYEGGITGGASGSNRGGRGGSNFLDTAGYSLTSTTNTSSAADADGEATTATRPAAATTAFSGFTVCLGTRFAAGNGATNAMTASEKAGDGRVKIVITP